MCYQGFDTVSGDIPELDSTALHVWRAELDVAPDIVRALYPLLTADEKARVERYRRPIDQKTFVVCRGTLRRLLGHYLNRDPKWLRFDYGRWGKPAISSECKNLEFNLSHSGNIALFAIARQGRIGIDVEHVRPDLSYSEIARQFFAPQEYQELCSLPLDSRREAFFSGWTRKEAYIKATGKGLSEPLDRFVVTLAPGGRARLLDVAGQPVEAGRWVMQSLRPRHDYVAAVAYERAVRSIRCLIWSPKRIL